LSAASPRLGRGRLRDLLDQLARLLRLRLHRDIGLSENADRPIVLDHRQPTLWGAKNGCASQEISDLQAGR
jgi:hypothetical protein